MPVEDPTLGQRRDIAAVVASWLLRGPLAVAIGVLCLAQLATWIPHYLTWPLFVDHDVYATIAQGWDAGKRPYRDCVCNEWHSAWP